MTDEAANVIPLLVPPSVSEAKLSRELDQWEASRHAYIRRGYWLLGRKDLAVEVAFVASVFLNRPTPIVVTVARIDFTNYDIWAPSVEFIDSHSGQFAPPLVEGWEFDADGRPRNVILANPETGRPFACLAGVREYHAHPQHSGDDWLLHRDTGDGKLAVICERLWERMVKTVVGAQLTGTFLPPNAPSSLRFALLQGHLAEASVAAPTATGSPAGEDHRGSQATPSDGDPTMAADDAGPRAASSGATPSQADRTHS